MGSTCIEAKGLCGFENELWLARPMLNFARGVGDQKGKLGGKMGQARGKLGVYVVHPGGGRECRDGSEQTSETKTNQGSSGVT